jgi:hypothetical protein
VVVVSAVAVARRRSWRVRALVKELRDCGCIDKKKKKKKKKPGMDGSGRIISSGSGSGEWIGVSVLKAAQMRGKWVGK